MAKKNEGKKFEEDFQRSFDDNVYIHRVRDVQGYRGSMSLCDFILFDKPNLFLLELKSTAQNSMPFANINWKQVEELNKLNVDGLFSGYVFNMRKHEKTYFIPTNIVHDFISTNNKQYESSKGSIGRKSFPIEYIEDNGLLIEQSLIRTRYRYDIDKFRKDLTLFLK